MIFVEPKVPLGCPWWSSGAGLFQCHSALPSDGTRLCGNEPPDNSGNEQGWCAAMRNPSNSFWKIPSCANNLPSTSMNQSMNQLIILNIHLRSFLSLAKSWEVLPILEGCNGNFHQHLHAHAGSTPSPRPANNTPQSLVTTIKIKCKTRNISEKPSMTNCNPSKLIQIHIRNKLTKQTLKNINWPRETLPNLKDLVDIFDFMITNISCTHDELLQILATVLLPVMTWCWHAFYMEEARWHKKVCMCACVFVTNKIPWHLIYDPFNPMQVNSAYGQHRGMWWAPLPVISCHILDEFGTSCSWKDLSLAAAHSAQMQHHEVIITSIIKCFSAR